MTKRLYVLRDTLAETILGGLHLFAHDASAVRFFGDLMSDPNTMLHRHPQDHDLMVIGELIDGLVPEIIPFTHPQVVITGAAWKAAQAPAPEANNT